jgi:hypothetical protein
MSIQIFNYIDNYFYDEINKHWSRKIVDEKWVRYDMKNYDYEIEVSW